MGVSPFETEGKFVSHGFADERCAGGESRRNDRRGLRRRLLICKPVGITAAGAVALHVDQIFDGKCQTIERAVPGSRKAAHAVRNERAEVRAWRLRDRIHFNGSQLRRRI